MDGDEKKIKNFYDVVIIGAGISGINSAYRVQTQLPGLSYTILEGRGALGGTWDLFKYPGIRSDSDLFTFGFPWRPWQEQKPIADGASIVKYVRETAEMYGIDKHIQYNNMVKSSNWSSDEQSWTIEIETQSQTRYMRANHIILSTGYYDYQTPLPVTIPGLSNFAGPIIHPQFWPSSLDYTGKKIVIIGSGATAVTLLPNLAPTASKVTMLQRSPGYLVSLPNLSTTSWWHRLTPSWLSYRLSRLRYLIIPFLFFKFCRAYPSAARRALKRMTTRQLPKTIPHDPHFEPSYNPWEQRLCVCPNGDFYKCLRSGKADVATGTIREVDANGVRLESGQYIEADIIVTATGLKIQLAGGAKLSVDNEVIPINERFLWKGVMLQDLPNLSFVIGYTNASWTLGADATALLVCRLIKYMRANGITSAAPRLEDEEELQKRPVLNLNSTYVEAAKGDMPHAGDKGPWRARDNYFVDWWQAKFGDIKTGLQFTRVST
ncbi:MAG: hypothetical protein M1820_006595 [Bogoriella megaspora]|nr:MAG: hypothetical protein M1820_006595 [Bogoriella megaspora]